MRKYHRFIPSTLKAIDRQFLLNRPVLWATRIHYIAFLSVAIWAILSFRLGIFEVDFTNIPNSSLQGMLLFIPAFLMIAFWAYQANLFNSKRLFGEMNLSQEFRNQFLYLGGVLLIACAPLVYGMVLSQKIADAITTEELVEDINTLNIGDQFFKIMPHALEDHHFGGKYNTFAVSNGFHRFVDRSNTEAYIYGYEQVKRLANSASRCTQKRYIHEYMQVLQKYSGHDIPQSSGKVLESFNHNEYIFGKELANARSQTRGNLLRLTEANAQQGIFQTIPALQLILLAILVLSLGLWVFVKVSWKFFLSALALTGGLLLFMLISGALMSMGLKNYMGIHIQEDDMFLMLMIGGCGLLLYQGLNKNIIPSVNFWPVIATVSSFMLLPVIGIGLVEFLKDSLHIGNIWGNPEGIYAILSIFLGASVLWNVFYSPQLDHLQLKPKER